MMLIKKIKLTLYMNKENVIILGSGPAGLTAGLYLARAGFKPLLIEGPRPGGWLTTTTIVENYPGFPDGIEGFELIMKIRQQAEKYGCQIISDVAQEVDISEGEIKIKGQKDNYLSQSLIISTGTNPRKLGVEGEEKFWGKGVAVCATCDGAFFKDKKVMVVGSGNTALVDAFFLTKFTSQIKLLNRGDKFRAEDIRVQELKENKNIEILEFTEIKQFLGKDKLEKVELFNSKTDKSEEVEVDGVFLAIGHNPNTNLFKNSLELTEKAYIKVGANSTKTSQIGVFACGDVMDPKYQQAVVSAGTGCMAALDVQNYLDSLS
jgi:thioredoxin reductase (NADPH)